MTNWKPVIKKIVELSIIATLYVLASPIYLTFAAMRSHRLLKALFIVASGVLTCIHCGHDNLLNRLATCNKCKATEYGSILYCSFCHQVSRYLSCGGCGVTLRVIPEQR